MREIDEKLILSAAQGDLGSVADCLDDGADIDYYRDPPGFMTPLAFSVFRGHNDIAKLLIERGANVNAKDDVGLTPLHWASCAAIAKLLIERGADVNAATNGGRDTPLHSAAREGHNDIAKLLIECGADVNAMDREGVKPLDYATCHEALAMIEAEDLGEMSANIAAAPAAGDVAI